LTSIACLEVQSTRQYFQIKDVFPYRLRRSYKQRGQ
jgi:hypothetical protein